MVSTNALMEDPLLALFDHHKEERRGSGRKGTPTSKPRQKWNCSRRNHGCHGYRNEKSRLKCKGLFKGRNVFLVDAEFGPHRCALVFDASRRLDAIRYQ